jgi:hypothetical protein
MARDTLCHVTAACGCVCVMYPLHVAVEHHLAAACHHTTMSMTTARKLLAVCMDMVCGMACSSAVCGPRCQ